MMNGDQMLIEKDFRKYVERMTILTSLFSLFLYLSENLRLGQ
jgi:hypothetical protein